MAKKVLVVDDDKDIVTYLTTFLEDNDYEVRTASDGVEAMEALKQERPDLVLLDLEMPQETGTGLYRKIRKRDELAELPIIVVSGHAGRNVAVGKNVPVIEKPIDRARLLAEIQKILGD